jgi:hypothetical protein
MSLTPDDFDAVDGTDDQPDVPLGDALAELSVDLEVDSVAEVRRLREDV